MENPEYFKSVTVFLQSWINIFNSENAHIAPPFPTRKVPFYLRVTLQWRSRLAAASRTHLLSPKTNSYINIIFRMVQFSYSFYIDMYMYTERNFGKRIAEIETDG